MEDEDEYNTYAYKAGHEQGFTVGFLLGIGLAAVTGIILAMIIS